MSSLGSNSPHPKPKPSLPKEEEEEEEEEGKEEIIIHNVSTEDQEEPLDTLNWVSTHLHLKPPHFTGSLDKEAVLTRIRQRNRASKVQATVQGFFGLPFPAKGRTYNNHSKVSIKWVDDAFAAP